MAYVSEQVRVVAARIAGKSEAMDFAATRIMRSAQTLAAPHRDTGNYIRSFEVVTVPGLKGNGRLVDDRLVVNNDPAAAAIEWGHLYRYKNSRRVKFIPGQHIMTRAMRKA